MYYKHVIGKNGESIATEYLTKKGYKIIERNFHCKTGEIDIIALDKKYLVFIEVKTRTNTKYGTPSEAVTKRKLESLYRTARFYAYTRNLQDEYIRFDAIEVYMQDTDYKINHIMQII